jgi:ABC-type polysaccharide/polyol phosphate transport system ATPase subunit/glycosyltransferase involved in cell wall biosynthesis
MTRIVASLTRELPTRIGVGRGTVLYLEGTCASDAGRVRDLAIIANGVRTPSIAHGMPPPGSREPFGDYWWALVTVPSESVDELTLGVRATLADGGEASAPLGAIELRSEAVGDIGHGNGGTVPSQENGHARWRPKDGPLIAIAMATHEPPLELFRRQIESIRSQTHENWVCVISDDASDPERLDAIREILGDDPRFRLFTSPGRRGVYRNFERALELTPREAEFLALCDQDDYWYPEKLATLREAIGPDDKLAYSDMRIVTAEGELISDTYWSRRRNNHTNYASLLIANTVTGAAALFRRDVLDYALPFPPEVDEQKHDHWIAIVAMALGDIHYVPRPLYDYVQHAEAELGHAAANQGSPSSPGQRLETIRSHGLLDGWRRMYFQHYIRLLLTARVVQLRCWDQLRRDRRKARSVSRVLSSDSVKGVGWLSLRSLRARLGASETMQRDGALARAISWLRISRVRARLARRQQPTDEPEVERLDLQPGAGAPTSKSLAVQVDGLYKSFEVPLLATQTIATRIRHPRLRHGYRTLRVLKDISFEIGQGEFFGIIGRNGSGKSTLLKLLASIYRADRGRILVGGQIVPIIELGLGFHPELAARDNLVIQGVMMGLTRKQAESRFERAMSFAGLEGFESMKLRNYSSGMKVRLAFAIMVEVDGDVMMIDEVLAVGDSAFQRKSYNIFQSYKDREKTVILVSHQMTAIQELCDRVLLLEGGRIERIGDPDACARRYSELAVAGKPSREEHLADNIHYPAEIVDLWIGDLQGDTSPIVEPSGSIHLHAMIETKEEIENASFRLEVRNQNRARIFSPMGTDLNGGERLPAGERLHVEATIENRLTPDVYYLSCAVNRRDEGGNDKAVSDAKSIQFAIPGDRYRGQGLLRLEHAVTMEDMGTLRHGQKGGQEGS